MPLAEQDVIPESLLVFFQEVAPAQLDVTRDAETIIERTLRFGNRAELRWLFHFYGRSRLAAWLRNQGEYRLPEPQLTFWRLILDIETPPHQSEKKAIWPH